MPTKQIPLLSNQGIHLDGDVPSSNGAGLPYFVNGYFENADNSNTEARKVAYVKRQGVNTVVANTFTAGHVIAGMIGSLDRKKIIVYTNNGTANRTWLWDGSSLTNVGVAPAAAGNWTYTGPVVFTQLDGISYGANNYYAVTDFSKGAVVNASGVWSEITDPDFTGLTKTTNLVGLDGYIFVGASNNRIYNSDLNSATAWTSTSFISASDTPGELRWLSVIRNYLIAFKDRSIEFFEDVGNPTPGSPLESRKQMNSKIGCPLPSSIREVSDGIIFVGLSENNLKIYKIMKSNLQIKKISNRYIEQCLALTLLPNIGTFTPRDWYSVDSIFTAKHSATYSTALRMNGQSQCFSVGGKEFYCINLHNPNNVTTNQYSHLYDNDLETWVSWASATEGANVDDTFGFSFTQAQMYGTGAVISPIFADNNPVTLGTAGNARLVRMAPDAVGWGDCSYTGSGTNSYNFSWTSDLFDFGSRKRKFIDSVELHYDISSGTTPANIASSTITLGYRDFDYSVGLRVTRTLNLQTGGGVRCIARRLGSTRRRVFDFKYSAASALRIWALEVQFNEGETDQQS